MKTCTSSVGSGNGSNGTEELFTIMKFGGSSIKDSECIKRVANIVNKNISVKPIVILSAIGKTTDELLELGESARAGHGFDVSKLCQKHLQLAKELELSKCCTNRLEALVGEMVSLLTGISLVKELSQGMRDSLSSFGERMSVEIVSAYFETLGQNSKPLASWDIGLMAQEYKNANDVEIISSSNISIKNYFLPLKKEYNYIPVVTGYIAKDINGKIMTLGRGGSDFTASIIGAAVDAKEIQIWTDVDGVLTADPRIVRNARNVDIVSLDEASELSFFGAKVLHPKTMLPAMSKNIPIRIKNSYSPDHPGTLAVNQLKRKDDHLVTAITNKTDVYIIEVNSKRMLGSPGFLAKLFNTCKDLKISIDVLATSEVSVSLSLDKETTKSQVEELVKSASEFCEVKLHSNQALLSIVGNSRHSTRIIAKTCETLMGIGVPIQLVSYGASKISLTIALRKEDAEKATVAIHEAFFGIHAPST